MQLNLDPKLFEDHQVIFIRALIENIKIKLQEIGLEGSQLEDATANVAFSIASTIDGTTMIEADGAEVHPYLTFQTADDVITHSGENAYTHEFVYGVLKSLFDR